MSGLKLISTATTESYSERTENKELYPKDGDQIFLTSLPTGDPEDTKHPYFNLFDYYWIYTYPNQGGRGFINQLAGWERVADDDRLDLSGVPEEINGNEIKPKHKFAFWGYVHHIIHAEKLQDSWEPTEGPGGRKAFKETLNDFRIISLGFGHMGVTVRQLEEVYEEWGTLDKGVMRIKRTGKGMYDTSYTISQPVKNFEVPKAKLAEANKLPSIRDYFYDRYGQAFVPKTIENNSSPDNGDLF